MPRISFVLLLLAVTCYGCKKENNTGGTRQDGLNGRWKMTAVLDKPSTMLTPPPGSDGKVFLVFSGNTFTGKTVKNTISNGVLTVNTRDSITFGTHHSTLVAEDQWGGAFRTMLGACMLQSVHPCRPSAITWKSPEQIEINTPMRYVITLEKF